MEANNEMDFTIDARKESLNPKTITNYKNSYKRLRGLTGKDIKDMTEDEIKETITNAVNKTDPKKLDQPLPITMKQTLLNIAIVIRQVYNKPVEELIHFRTQGKGDLLVEVVEKNKGLKETLPSVKDLVDYTEKLYKEEKWVKYIINYILITFGTRNMDLNVIITTNDKQVNYTDNWLVIRKSSIRYMRYIFKTADKYDCRENEIKSEKFIHAVKQVLGDKESTPLLTTADGERIKEVNLNKYISRATLNELGQTKYFKILLNKDKANIERLSANRGTALTTLIEHYDLDFENAEGKQKEQAKKLTACSRIPKVATGKAKQEKKKTLRDEGIKKAQEQLQAEQLQAEEEFKLKELKLKEPKKRATLKKKKLNIIE